MSINQSLLSIGVIALLLLAVGVIMARLAAFILAKMAFQLLTDLKLKTLLKNQPWLCALLILFAFAFEYSLFTIPIVYRFFLRSHMVLPGLVISLELLRSALGLFLLIRESRAFYTWLKVLAQQRSLIALILPELKISLYLSLSMLIVPVLVPSFMLIPPLLPTVNKIMKVLIIWAVTCLFIQIIIVSEKLILKHSGDPLTEKYRTRRFYTQALMFRRIVISGVLVIGIAATLMVFESIRELGTSILASAGLATIILGFAAQKTLGNLFAGLQIAITQPIKINDALVLEGEFGTVEAITLTYVIIRIWDLRRLVLPINYFIEKPFQNFTMHSTNLLCPIIFFADYSLPIIPVRKAFMDILTDSSFWDGAVGILQVTDAKDKVLQLRALASAKNPGDSWNLRCEVLEKLIAFIVDNYPESLPCLRLHK